MDRCAAITLDYIFVISGEQSSTIGTIKLFDAAPGIYSARYAGGEGHDSAANNARLLRELDGITDRRARFRTAIALLIGDDAPRYFNGSVEGTILTEEHGAGGFGYDPLFQPLGWDKTFAEATPEEKNAVSHRGRAVRELASYLESL